MQKKTTLDLPKYMASTFHVNASSSHNIVVEFYKCNMPLHENGLANFHKLKIQRIKLGIDKVAELSLSLHRAFYSLFK